MTRSFGSEAQMGLRAKSSRGSGCSSRFVGLRASKSQASRLEEFRFFGFRV